MPVFRFPLEPLLTARRHEERRKQLALAEVEQRRRQLEDTLRAQQEFISAGRRSMSDRLKGRLDLAALRAHASSTIHLMRRANRILIELAGVHRQAEAARAELIEATRHRRAVELLRARRFEAWKTRIERAEDTETDEMGARTTARREG